MTEQQGTQQSTSEHAHDRCVCNEVIGHIQEVLGVSPEVRQHIANSRIEILKAIRTAIDQKIDRLSKPAQRGAKIAVE